MYACSAASSGWMAGPPGVSGDRSSYRASHRSATDATGPPPLQSRAMSSDAAGLSGAAESPDAAPSSDAPRGRLSIGLVLSAGGGAARSYHAGTLAALAADTGWDPRTADLIVGTS